MKQIIVMISMVILGIAIAAVVLGFNDDVDDMNDSISEGLSSIEETMDSYVGNGE